MMQNVQLYLGIVLFFGGTIWLIVSVGRARYERLAVAQSASNLVRAVDRRANRHADTDSDGH